MESLSLPTFPNVSGLQSQLLFEIFFVIISLLVASMLLIYFVVKYRRRKKLIAQLAHMQDQANSLGRQMLTQKMHEFEDKGLLVFFIEYLERFTTYMPYASIDQLLAQHGFEAHDIEVMMNVLHKHQHLPTEIKNKVLSKLTVNN